MTGPAVNASSTDAAKKKIMQFFIKTAPFPPKTPYLEVNSPD
jgi:hypothetical protein